MAVWTINARCAGNKLPTVWRCCCDFVFESKLFRHRATFRMSGTGDAGKVMGRELGTTCAVNEAYLVLFESGVGSASVNLSGRLRGDSVLFPLLAN